VGGGGFGVGEWEGHEGAAAIQHLVVAAVVVLADGRVLPAVLFVDPHPLAPRRRRVLVVVLLLLVLLRRGGERGGCGVGCGGRLVLFLAGVVLAALGSVGFSLRIGERRCL